MTRAAIGPAIIVPCLGLALWAGVAAQAQHSPVQVVLEPAQLDASCRASADNGVPVWHAVRIDGPRGG